MPMKATARQHHFLPVFYLSGFTERGTQNGRLHVFDYIRDRHYTSTPVKVARERDYYRVEGHSQPDVLETALSHIESAAAVALKTVTSQRRVASRKQLPELLAFVALLFARGPRVREQMGRRAAAQARTDLASGKMTEQRWNAIRQAEISAGAPERLLPSYADARRMSQAGRWEPPFPRTFHREFLPVLYEALTDKLLRRPWLLMRCDASEHGGFICSDTPLSTLEEGLLGLSLAPLDDPDVLVTCPLSRELALVSLTGMKGGNYEATPLIVADINTRTQLASMGTLYSATKAFLLRRGDRADSSLDYFEFVRRQRSRGLIRP
jgi:hypothetical protein